MTHKEIPQFLTLFAAALFVAGVGLPASTAHAEPTIKRLDPRSFPGLAASVRRTLGAHDCTIPQEFEAERRMNIIRGHFVDRRRRDVAALCSHGGKSSILVIHSKTGQVLAVLAEWPDEHFLQTVDNAGTYGFSRRLGLMSPRMLRQDIRAAKMPLPAPWREGIDDYFVDKASQVHYRHRASWHVVLGAD